MKIIHLDRSNSYLLDNVAPDVFDHAIRPDSLKAFLDCPRHIMVLAAENDLVVGMASAFEYFHPDKPPQMFINEVGVSPAFRNQGTGRKLVMALLDIALERGDSVAWLGTAQGNLSAQRCFDGVPGANPAENFLLYEWKLDR